MKFSKKLACIGFNKIIYTPVLNLLIYWNLNNIKIIWLWIKIDGFFTFFSCK
uniref:Candidate secreted effector n=1 Tax=Meloidogyne incognita TaxID=6306 RepID=A0A914KIB6_MELIC